jgi:hypothetical protein
VSIQNGTITQTKFNKQLYIIIPNPDNGRVTITITQGKRKEVQYYVYKLPPTELLFNGRNYPDRTIPVSEFKKYLRTSVLFTNFTYNIVIELQSCKIMRITPDDKISQYTTSGKDYLSINLTHNASPGDKIVFYDLVFKTEGTGYVFKGQDCVYIIK